VRDDRDPDLDRSGHTPSLTGSSMLTVQVNGPATVAPLDETVDHVRGSPSGRLILDYGDYECPYSRTAYREIQRVARQLGDGIRRDVESGSASGEVRGTPTLFIDGVVHRGSYDAATLLEALA